MGELRDSAITAATCELTARVLRNDAGPLVARVALPGLVLAGLGGLAFVTLPAAVGVLLVVLAALPLAAAAVLLTRRGSAASGHLLLEADGFTYRALRTPPVSLGWQACDRFEAVPLRWTPGRVAWTGRDGAGGGAFLPGAGGLPPEDLAVLLNRYRQRYAPDAPRPAEG